jgi:hypothetical protein
VPGRKEIYPIADRLNIPPPRRETSGGASVKLRCTSFLLYGLLLFFPAWFATAEQPDISAGVDIRTNASPQTAAIGDPIRIDLDITIPAGYTVDIPEPAQQTGDFSILEFFPGSIIPVSNGSEKETQLPVLRDGQSQRYRAGIVAAVYKTGTFTFPGIPVYITDDRGHKTELESPPVDVEIQSTLTGDDTGLRDLKKQADIPGEVPWLWWILLAAAVCILCTAAWFVRRKFRATDSEIPSGPAQDPLDLAESELRNLIALNLPENGQTKKFYVRLSEIVKRILEAAYGIATVERTTIEIMESLHRQSGFDHNIPEAVQSLLLQCDVVKFAKYIPSKSENDHAADEALRILFRAREYTVDSRQSVAGSAEFEEVANKS